MIWILLACPLLLTPYKSAGNSTQAAISGSIYTCVVRPTSRKKRQVNKITLSRAKIHSYSDEGVANSYFKLICPVASATLPPVRSLFSVINMVLILQESHFLIQLKFPLSLLCFFHFSVGAAFFEEVHMGIPSSFATSVM